MYSESFTKGVVETGILTLTIIAVGDLNDKIALFFVHVDSLPSGQNSVGTRHGFVAKARLLRGKNIYFDYLMTTVNNQDLL